jgi:hypothetical protein
MTGGPQSTLAWSMEGLWVDTCGHRVVEMEADGEDDGSAAAAAAAAFVATGTLQQQALGLDVSLPVVRLLLPLAADEVERVVDVWAVALCTPMAMMPPLGGEESLQGRCPRFPGGSIGAFVIRLLEPRQRQQQPQPRSYSCSSLRVRVRRASAVAALSDGRALQAEARGIHLDAAVPSSDAASCSWTGQAAAVSLVLLRGSEEVAVLAPTAVGLKGVSPLLLAPGGPWAAEIVFGGSEDATAGSGGLHVSLASELAEALAAVQQRLSILSRRVGLSPPLALPAAAAAAVGEREREQPLAATGLQEAQHALSDRLTAAMHKAQTSIAAARAALGAARVAHGEGMQRQAAQAVGLTAALAAKELQRRQLAAVHHADHMGYLHVGTLTAGAVEERQRAKALLALPQRWCVLRGDLLLVYDHPHSFHLERALSLRHAGPAASPLLRELALADARTSKHYRRLYALVCARGEGVVGAATAVGSGGLPVFLACEAGAEAAAWRVAIRPFLEHAQQQQQQQASSAAPTAPRRRFPLLASPRSASSGGGSTVGATAVTPASSSSHTGRPPLAGKASVFTRRAKAVVAVPGTPVTNEGPTTALLLSTPASSAAAAPPSADGPASKPTLPPPPFVCVSVSPSPTTATTASYVLTVGPWALGGHERSSAVSSSTTPGAVVANNEPPQQATASPSPISVTRSWGEVLAFHNDYLPRWLRTKQQQQQGGREHAPTGMGPAEAMSYADQLLRGSHALLHTPAPTEPERQEQARVLTLYLHLLLTACPQQQPDGDEAVRACRATLQRFLGLPSLPAAMPPSLQDAAAAAAPAPDAAANPVEEALQAADVRLRRAEAAVLRMHLTGALQAAVAADRERAAAAERAALTRRVQELEEALAAERARVAALEREVGAAVLARDDAVQAMTEVSTDAARKLMLGELRYLNLLKRAHPKAHAAEQESHSRRHSHHHATNGSGSGSSRPMVASPPPFLSSSLRASPPPPAPVLSRASSSGAGGGSDRGGISPRNAPLRQLSSGGAGLEDSRTRATATAAAAAAAAATTAQQRREQLEQLLRQPTPPPRSPRSLTPPLLSSTAVVEGTVTRAHHTEVVYRLKALVAAKEEEARALGEALALAQAEVEGRVHRACTWRRLAAEEQGEGHGDGDGCDDDGLFAPWRARVALERAARAAAEGRLEASRAQWAGLVEGLSGRGKEEEKGEDVDVDVDPGLEWEWAWREYQGLLGLARGLC